MAIPAMKTQANVIDLLRVSTKKNIRQGRASRRSPDA
jgi:hypothetical protein